MRQKNSKLLHRIASLGPVLYGLFLIVLILAELGVYVFGALHPMRFSDYIRTPSSKLESRIIDGAWAVMTEDDLSQIPSYLGPVLPDKCKYQYTGKYKTWMHEYIIAIVADSPTFTATARGAFILDLKIRPIFVFMPLCLGLSLAIGGWFCIPFSEEKLVWERYRIKI